MGNYGITGWSGGGRRPINYGLHAGQFRTTKYNVPHNTTIINNNIFGGGFVDTRYRFDYARPSFMCEQNTTPKWMNWMMGTGFGLSMLGGIMSLFSGKEAEQGGTETVQPQPSTDEFAGLKREFDDYEFNKITDGLYTATSPDGKKYDGTSITNLYYNITNGIEAGKKPDPEPETEQVQQGDVQGSVQQHTDLPETEHDYLAEFYEQLKDKGYAVINTKTLDEGENITNMVLGAKNIVDHGEDENGNAIKDIKIKGNISIKDGTNEIKDGTIIIMNNQEYEIDINDDGYVFAIAKNPTGGQDKNPQVYILETHNGTTQWAQWDGLAKDYTHGAGKNCFTSLGGGAVNGVQQTQSATTYSANSVNTSDDELDAEESQFKAPSEGTIYAHNVETDAIKYNYNTDVTGSTRNAIYKEVSTMWGGGLFADAVFRINDNDYQIAESSLKDIRWRDFSENYLDKDKKFKAGALTGTFHGDGPLDGAEISTQNGVVCVYTKAPGESEAKYYDLNLLMSNNQYVEV